MKKAIKKNESGNRNKAAGNGIFLTGIHAISIGCMAALIILLAILSHERNFAWDTKLSLWSDVAMKSPRKSRAHNNLGNCYALLGRLFDAIEEYKIAISLDKKNIEAYYNLGIYLEDVGILNQAVFYYDAFCKGAPSGYAEHKRVACRRAEELSRRLISR